MIRFSQMRVLALISAAVLSGCATTSEKISGPWAEGHWKTQARRELGPTIEPAATIGPYRVLRIEHRFTLEHRRKHHFYPLEKRWMLNVFVHGKDAS